jgi:tRNA-modifying protein YgfZ
MQHTQPGLTYRLMTNMNQASYDALRNHAAAIPLTGRGLICMSDEDRLRLLHAMCTQAVDQLKPGDGARTLFLNDKGRILAECSVLCREDDLLLDTEAASRSLLYNHLDHYIIMDEVELEDLSDTYAIVGVEGPASADLLAGMGASLPEPALAHHTWEDALIANISQTGASGYRLYLPAAAPAWLERLAAAGIPACDEATAEVVRLEQGRKRHGFEYGDQHLVHEAQVLDYVSFTKGCYLGQEIVERVRSQGNVNRSLVRLVAALHEAPARDTPVTAGEAQSGKVLNAAYSPALGKTIVWALVRNQHVKEAATFQINGAEATLAAPGNLT